MTCMYAYFEYQDPEDLEQDLVHIETQAGFWTIDDPVRVAEYRRAHDNLIGSSFNMDDSRALIQSIRDSMSPSLARLSPLLFLTDGWPYRDRKVIYI